MLAVAAAFRIYAQRGEDAATTREVDGRALNSHGNYIVDHGNSWKIMEFFLSFRFICAYKAGL